MPDRRVALSLLCALPAVIVGASASAAPEPNLRVTLAPARPDADQHVRYVDVTVTAEGMSGAQGAPLLRLPLVANTVVTSGAQITGLTISDRQGTIAARVEDIDEDASNRTRFWRAPRQIEGTVTIQYRVPVDADAPPLALPQYEMRTELGGFSAAGNAFLILPDDKTPRRASVEWNFSAYGPGGKGVSSLGVGNAASRTALPAGDLSSMYYMGGKPGVHPPAADGFFAAWQGTPPFPMTPLMDWASDLHRYYGTFFGYAPPSFGVFGRTNQRNPGSGIGLTDSFAFTFNDTSKPAELRSLLAHEMLHAWVNSLEASMDAAGGLDRSWFGEGLAVHYQRLLPYRAGLITAEDFLSDLNETAARYYTNIKINVPNADIPAGFWRDTRIRVLPYDRGSLYFAATDAAIRRASGGKRSLDDLVRTMLAERRAGRPMDEALYRRLLKADLGDAGIAAFEAMLRGQVVLPPSDAFGAQFRRVEKPLRRFDLGFDPASLLARPKIVKGLIPGSNAQAAGLREGDEILNTFSQDGLQGDQQAFLSLEVKRGDEKLSLRYQPRGETVSAYQWESAQ
ncbi:peptidase M61 [Novosphingobium guangzhouense]|uniref:Peptidase M61 n=1 Tax=Novosphingobium guangzhouense TaxID=1850347 RepID=A0A2K2FXF5_9SPHN|nr:peptidase M61 [Novosphingobium guangzhouense]PNU03469.1 peptidase M61 [Novosphingobium guangzhouense]